MNRIQYIIEVAKLIVKNLSYQLNSEEKERLGSWKKESSKHKDLYNKITDWNNFQERNRTWNSFDADQGWEQFSGKLKKKQSPFRLNQILRYASVIIMLIVLGGSLFYYLNIQQKSTSAKVASISPGTQSAIIVLDNGQSINLEDKELNQLVEKDGSVIQNRKGELSYSDIKPKRAKKQLQNTLIVPRGGEYNLVLSDGSRVFLNSVSKLSYPVAFNKNKREVSLEGEAYFEIAKDKSKPFVVNINGMKVEVLGTSFNVKAYNDENEIYTTLVEGKIRLKSEENDDEWILKPDQQAVLKRNTNKVVVHNVDAMQFVGWKNGVYYFSNQSVEDIMKTLSRWYDFEYDFNSEEIRNIRFEGGLNKYEDIYPILDIMQSTAKLNYRIEGKKITFVRN